MFLRSLLIGSVFAVLATTPAAAQVSLAPLKPCYVAAQPSQTEIFTVTGSGFTPRAHVEIYVDEVLTTTAEVLLTGTVSGQLAAPFVESGEREFTLRLTEVGMPANTISAVSRVTRFSVEQSPKRSKTNERVTFRGRGFTLLPQPVYAHYVFGGRSFKTVKLGMPKGNCGTFSVKRRQFPFKKRPRIGTWTIQFDQNVYYDPFAAVRVPMQIKVKKAPKSKRSRAHRSGSS
jgi:hypothetical protein